MVEREDLDKECNYIKMQKGSRHWKAVCVEGD